MVAKLDENSRKGTRLDWREDSPRDLLRRVRQEVEELAEVIEYDDPAEVLEEAADVANMAMMVADAFAYRHRKDTD